MFHHRTIETLTCLALAGSSLLGTATGAYAVQNECMKLIAADGGINDRFGHAVDIHDGVAIVSAFVDDTNGLGEGSAYLIEASTGALLHKLYAEDGEEEDYFGNSVAISSGMAIVGAWGDDDNGDRAGSAYLFDTATGQQLWKLLPDDAKPGDQFGASVALSDGIALVGANFGNIDDAPATGSAYLFDAATGTQTFVLRPDSSLTLGWFGQSVALGDGLALIGAPGARLVGLESGSAYVFDVLTGQMLRELRPDDPGAFDNFGASVAIRDGRALVGAPGDDDSAVSAGAVYVFDLQNGLQLAKLRPADGDMADFFGYALDFDEGVAVIAAEGRDQATGTSYLYDLSDLEQIAVLEASDRSEGDRFGTSVAISGGFAIVGTPFDDDLGNASGSACIFAAPRDGLFKIRAGDGDVYDQFGESVGLSQGIAIVGARWDSDQGHTSGAAYLYDLAGCEELPKLLPDDGMLNDEFGNAVAIDQGVALVGAWLDDDDGGGSGAAYLFDVSTGQQLHKLLPDDGVQGVQFGAAVALADGVALVATTCEWNFGSFFGAAYLFDAATGQQLHKLLPLDSLATDCFGSAVAISGGVAMVGAYRDDDKGFDSGSVYLFDVATGQQIHKLVASDGTANDYFGRSVDIADGLAIVGAHYDEVVAYRSGSAYVFDVATGQQLRKISPNDGEVIEEFGRAVALDHGLAVVGAHFDDDNGSQSGSAYLFDATTGQQLDKLLPHDGGPNDAFGFAVDVANGVAIVGAYLDDDAGLNSGSVYVTALDPGDLVITSANPISVPRRSDRIGSVHPNPFNPTTTVEFEMRVGGATSLAVFNLRGELVRTLLGSVELPAGRHAATWNGTDDHGRMVASGVYFVRLRTPEGTGHRKVALIK